MLESSSKMNGGLNPGPYARTVTTRAIARNIHDVRLVVACGVASWKRRTDSQEEVGFIAEAVRYPFQHFDLVVDTRDIIDVENVYYIPRGASQSSPVRDVTARDMSPRGLGNASESFTPCHSGNRPVMCPSVAQGWKSGVS